MREGHCPFSHDHDRDAQQIYSEEHTCRGIVTDLMMVSGVLLSYLTSEDFVGSWRGATDFVLGGLRSSGNTMTVLVADRLSDNVQRTMLQNAVLGLTELRCSSNQSRSRLHTELH
jgi:hypothetical protein